MIDAVDLAANEDADATVGPLASVGEQEGNEQSQACNHKHSHKRSRFDVGGESVGIYI